MNRLIGNVILAAAVLCFSCHPDAVLGPQGFGKKVPNFTSPELSWTEIDIPPQLLNEWDHYPAQGNNVFSLSPQHTIINNEYVRLESVSYAEPYYRVIYSRGSDYGICYLESLRTQTAFIYYANSTASDMDEAALLPVDPYSKNLWSRKPALPVDSLFEPGEADWAEVAMPADFIGRWYGSDTEIVIRADSLVIGGEVVTVESVANCESCYRIIYGRGNSYSTVYARDLQKRSSHSLMYVAFADGSTYDGAEAERLPIVPDLDVENMRIIPEWMKIRTAVSPSD